MARLSGPRPRASTPGRCLGASPRNFRLRTPTRLLRSRPASPGPLTRDPGARDRAGAERESGRDGDATTTRRGERWADPWAHPGRKQMSGAVTRSRRAARGGSGPPTANGGALDLFNNARQSTAGEGGRRPALRRPLSTAEPRKRGSGAARAAEIQGTWAPAGTGSDPRSDRREPRG